MPDAHAHAAGAERERGIQRGATEMATASGKQNKQIPSFKCSALHSLATVSIPPRSASSSLSSSSASFSCSSPSLPYCFPLPLPSDFYEQSSLPLRSAGSESRSPAVAAPAALLYPGHRALSTLQASPKAFTALTLCV